MEVGEAPISWDGEPAPDRGAPDILVVGARPGDRPKGDLMVPLGDGSFGEVLEGELERFGTVAACAG